MTEAEYIEATNLAKIRMAWHAMHEVVSGYGPVSEEKRKAITIPLSGLLDECYQAMRITSAAASPEGEK